jgi:hypothetical protein
VSVVINQLFEAGKIKTGARSCRVSAKQVLAQKIHYLEMAIFKNQAEGTNLKKTLSKAGYRFQKWHHCGQSILDILKTIITSRGIA